MDIAERLERRFLRYVGMATQSDAGSRTLPSTPGQLDLARLLYSELQAMGIADLAISDEGIVTAVLPGTPDRPKIGFVAHLDTVDVGLSPAVRARKIRYDGQDILLNEAEGIYFDKVAHPEIERYRGDDIYFSDGTSVLGADNKAAISVVMCAIESVLEEGIPHGDLFVAFVPDEEIGLKGAKRLDLERFRPDYAYTIDCCELGEVVYETFNAGTATIGIEGVTAHPMSAKGVLLNPVLVAHDFISLFDRAETPERTEGKEGYVWFNRIAGGQSSVTLQASIRDHSLAAYEDKKRRLLEAGEEIRRRYPRAKVSVGIEDVYANIANHADRSHPAVAAIYDAMAELGIEAKTVAMRGGTDGSALSAKGLVTPNYFTGAHLFHSRFEFLPVSSFVASYRLTRALIENAGRR